MNYDSREFFNGAKRRTQLLREGNIMHMGNLSDTTWSDDVLSIVKNALPIINGQRVFNAQLKGGTLPATQPKPAPTNWGRIAMLGGAGVLGVILLKSVLSRR